MPDGSQGFEVDRKVAGIHLEVKSHDDEQRYIAGMATTPTVDRVGDIVEPMGAAFEPEIPLFLDHDKRMRVGRVRLGKPTSKGIPFEAWIPKVTEAGPLKDRVDTAWQEVKYGLLKCVSIGFKPIGGKDAIEFIEDGIRFLKYQIFELSLVPVPANADARIQTFKSTDVAAPGRGVVRLNAANVAGASAKSTAAPKDNAMQTVQEKISKWEAKHASLLEQRSAVIKKAEDDGDRTLTEAEVTERAEITKDIESVTQTIKALKEEAEVVKATARPVDDEVTTSRPVRSAVPHLLSIKQQDDEPGMAFARYVKCHMIAKGDPFRAQSIMKSMYPNEQRINLIIGAEAKKGQMIDSSMLTKANVLAATTTDATWAGALVQYQDIATEFLDWLRPQTIVGKFGANGVPGLTRVDFNSRVRAQTSGGTAYWVGEGKPMALTKIACIAVVTQETLRLASPSADNLVREALRGAVIERMDRDFIDPDFAGSAAVSPASITYGAPSAAASGVLNSSFIADTGTAVDSLLQYFPEATLSGLVWLMAGRQGYRLGQGQNSLGQRQFPTLGISGGDAGGIPVITSEYLSQSGGLSPGTGNIMVLVHAPSIFLADDGQVTLNASGEASLQMLDNPTNDSVTPTATTMVSMFQTNSVAILAERSVNWKRARDGAVYVVTGAAYTGAAA
jgi:hypothetical protein